MFHKALKPFSNLYRRKYRGIYRHAKKLFIFDLLLLFSALVIFVSTIVLLLWKPGLANLVDLSISLGDKKIKSGQEVAVLVDYANRSKYALKNVSLGLRLPDGFIINRQKTPLEIFSENSTFPGVRELEPNAKGQIEVYGWLWGVPGKDENIIAAISYAPENDVKNREQKYSYFYAALNNSLISGTLEAPTTSFADKQIPLDLTFVNNSAEKQNLTITYGWPQKIDALDDLAVTLEPQKSFSARVFARSPGSAGEYEISVTPSVTINNRVFPQVPLTKPIKIIFPHLFSAVKILEEKYAQTNSKIPIEIAWKNNSGLKTENLKLTVSADINIIDWKKSALENNAAYGADSLIIDARHRTSLSDGGPDAGDAYKIYLYTLPSFSLGGLENARVEITPTLEAVLAPGQQAYGQEGEKASLPIATEIKFNAEPRYYTSEGDQLGRGLLPPQVNKTTKYWIFVAINNTTNAARNAMFNATLPLGIEFTGKQSVTLGEEIKYDKASRGLSWSYDKIPANSQTGLYFEVATLPDSSLAGKNIKLTENLNFSAVDEFTGKQFSFSAPPLYNILNKNDRGYEAGSKVSE